MEEKKITNKKKKSLFRFPLIAAVLCFAAFLVVSKFDVKDFIFSAIENRLAPKKHVDAQASSLFNMLPGGGNVIVYSKELQVFLKDLKRNHVLSRWSSFISGSSRGGISGLLAKKISFKLKERDILKLLGNEVAFKTEKGKFIFALEAKEKFNEMKNFFTLMAAMKARTTVHSTSHNGVIVSDIPGVGSPIHTAALGKYSLFSNRESVILASLDLGMETVNNKPSPIVLRAINSKHSYLAADFDTPLQNTFIPIVPSMINWEVWLKPTDKKVLNIGFLGIVKQGSIYSKLYKEYDTTFHGILKKLPPDTLLVISSNAIIPSEIYKAMRKIPYFRDSFDRFLYGHASPEETIFPFLGPRFFYFCDGVNDEEEVTVPYLRQGIGIEVHFGKDLRQPLNSIIREFFGIEGEPFVAEKRGQEYYYFDTETGITPSYTFFGSVLVVCLDKSSLLKMIDRSRGIGELLTHRKKFKKMLARLPEKYHHMAYFDLRALWGELEEHLELAQYVNNILMVAGVENDKFLFPRITSLLQGGAAAVSVENGKVNARLIIQ